jgi:hypothetical protein
MIEVYNANMKSLYDVKIKKTIRCKDVLTLRYRDEKIQKYKKTLNYIMYSEEQDQLGKYPTTKPCIIGVFKYIIL